ncbi:hypothetical protein [Millisia brevis]|uniref:hypothetical protein n=1 Tax=Millisia brevis TaxID=264148 RepID=UPI0014726BC0|nr:hypothetical protein [Millisia brevis]
MNWDLQNLIVAFVDTQKPLFDIQRQMYLDGLHGFAAGASNLLTMLGYPPVP